MNENTKIAGFFEIPEFCREYPIDWAQYTPPGGPDWLKYFIDTCKPTVADTLAMAQQDLASIKATVARRTAIRKGIEAATAIAKMISEFGAAYPAEIKSSAIPCISAWNEATLDIANRSIFASDDTKKTVAVIEEDVKFLTALDAYFTADLNLDIALYALWKVEPKFKAKIFRTAMRFLPIVETNRAIVGASTSVIKEHTWSIYKPAIEMLDDAYGVISKRLRQLKKAAAKGGAEFWRTAALLDDIQYMNAVP